jgi:hypothetical protein
MPRVARSRDVVLLVGALSLATAVTVSLQRLPDVNPTTVALALLLIVPGTACAENVPGAGALFDHGARRGACRDAGGAGRMGARILIVDDGPNIIGTLSPLLGTRQYDGRSAMTGRTATDVLDRDKPDLVILDLGLPDIAGVDVCREIRLSSGAPIVALSARGAEGGRGGC